MMCLPCLQSIAFFSVSFVFVLWSLSLTKLLPFGISFLAAVNTELVELLAKPLILGILFSISVILELKSGFLRNALVSEIFSSASIIFFSKSDLLVSYLVIKTNSVVLILSTIVSNLLYSVFMTISFLIYYLI